MGKPAGINKLEDLDVGGILTYLLHGAESFLRS